MKELSTVWASYGSSQEERLPQSLEDDYILPFENSLAHELASLGRLARSAEHSNTISSQWVALFAHEPAIALAELITLVDAASLSSGQNPEIEALIGLRIDQLRLSDATDIQRLAGLVSNATDFFNTRKRILDNRDYLKDEQIASSMADALSQHRSQLQELLEHRLKSGDIDPALGLLLSALYALRELKSRLNQFPDELLNHYYQQVLGLSSRKGAPTAISLIARANLLPVDIPDGTILAGVFAGNERISAKVVGSTRVLSAKVQKLCQLRHWRDSALAPINVLSWVSKVAAEQISDGGSQLFSASETPPLGLLIESPILELSGGIREIEIRLDMSHKEEIRSADGHGAASCSEAIDAFSKDPDLQEAFAEVNIENSEAVHDNTDNQLADQLSSLFRHWLHLFRHWIYNGETAEREWKGGDHDVQQWSAIDTVLAALLLQIDTPLQFRTVARRIVGHVLLSGKRQWPTETFLGLLRDAAQRSGMPDPVDIVGNYAPEDLFFLLLGDAFTAEISSAEEYFAPAAMYVTANTGDTPGIKFHIHLDATAPAVEAMEEFESPCVRLTLSPQARFSPVSLFEDVCIDAIDLSVTVKGLTQLSAFNDDGPVAVSQTILPFGSQPGDGSEFLVGSPEIGNKSIQGISLSYTLTDLPQLPDDGNLNAYYEHYGKEFNPPDPKLETAVLTADGWVSVTVDEPLICGAEKWSESKRHKIIQGNIANPVAPPPVKISATDFADRQSIRAGLVRLRLDTSGRHFGINRYPLALAESIRRSQRPLSKPKIPNPPLSIKFSSVSLDYRARRHIAIRAPSPANAKERIVQLGAFGSRQLYPSTSTADTTLFPRRLGDGTLYVGIGPDIPAGPVSLLFDFDDGGRERLPVATSQIAWHVLTNDGWQELSASSIYSDTTVGLHRTGVVALQLPASATGHASEMQAGLYWIAASATSQLDTYPFLKNVYLNGISASVESTDRLDLGSAQWLFNPPIPGLGDIDHIGETRREGKARESKTDFRARVAEGLHHRQRGVSAWDIERIVLEKYPQVWQCKCFSCCDGRSGQQKAGSITLLVIPHAPATSTKAYDEKMFDSITLDEIERTVRNCTNTFADITVRNPSFDRLQVRATVYFEHGASEGSLARKLTLALSDRLSVWTADKPMNRLGWSLNIDELTAFAETLPYIRAITHLEVLHLVHDRAEARFLQQDNFLLNDSVSIPDRTIRHHGLWSLPLSMSEHIITALSDESVDRLLPAGIGELSIGETLLVQQTPETNT